MYLYLKNFIMVYTLITLFTIVLIVSILWVKGLTDMMEEHPDYKGEDLFDEKPSKTHQ